MKLENMQETVAKYAETISSILGVSATVVDESLSRIGDTYQYPSEPEPVRENSILGQAVMTGKPMAVKNVKECEVCLSCENYHTCDLDGVIAVPIFFQGKIAGGFCLIVPESRQSLFEDVQVSIDFLENMADLLSEKMNSVVQLEAIENAYREREVIMNAIEDCLVSTDRSGRIDYFNERFESNFGGKKSSIGRNIRDMIPQQVIGKMLGNPYHTGGKLIYHKNAVRGNAFYGFVYCYPKSFGGREGILFAFRSINNINTALNEIYTHKAGTNFDWLGYHGAETKSVIIRAKQLAITDETILINGECGVGKEAIAKAIHNFSDRSEAYFITVDCKTISPEVMEEELFGFNSVTKQQARIGKIRLAHKGTILFLDINKMPLYLQDKIAKFMKTRNLNVPAKEEITVDVRMIFSSDEDLRELVEQGYFSESLYYRISKNELNIPALRNRPQTERHAALQNAIRFYRDKYDQPALIFEDDAIEALAEFHWQGNLQQLWNCIDRLVYSGQNRITAEDVREMGILLGGSAVKSLDALEKEQITSLLEGGYRKDDIAKMLKISRATLYRKLKKYNVS